jgi:hypothetical protein
MITIYAKNNGEWSETPEEGTIALDVHEDMTNEEITIYVLNHFIIYGRYPLTSNENKTAWRRARDIINKDAKIQETIVMYMITGGIAPSILKNLREEEECTLE